MGAMNWSRVFLGGLLAGVVLVVFGLINLFLFKEDLAAIFEGLGRPPELATEQLVYMTVLTLAIGIWAVWLYAAIRPRYGAGPKTAAIAGYAVWLILSLADLAWGSMVGFPMGLLATILAIYLVVIVVATVAGAWVYKED